MDDEISEKSLNGIISDISKTRLVVRSSIKPSSQPGRSRENADKDKDDGKGLNKENHQEAERALRVRSFRQRSIDSIHSAIRRIQTGKPSLVSERERSSCSKNIESNEWNWNSTVHRDINQACRGYNKVNKTFTFAIENVIAPFIFCSQEALGWN
ncbi:hypothetical protein [Leptospira jelokensis]|uniref:hypothetical protein n=1 Tax=Leptospira jelokensis TaxID=2484931 RepID=UPI00142D3C69|nr:hypothetical protein [Leptospira jelokensis]